MLVSGWVSVIIFDCLAFLVYIWSGKLGVLIDVSMLLCLQLMSKPREIKTVLYFSKVINVVTLARTPDFMRVTRGIYLSCYVILHTKRHSTYSSFFCVCVYILHCIDRRKSFSSDLQNFLFVWAKWKISYHYVCFRILTLVRHMNEMAGNLHELHL